MSRPPVARGADRFAARSRRRRLRRVLWSIAGLGGVASAGVLAWLIGWSDVTAVDGVEVSGAPGPVEQAVLDAADVPLGMPLIRVDTAAIAERIRAVPDVAAVDVRRGWPDAVEIDVTKREAAGTIEVDGQWWSIDREGVLFGASSERDLELVEVVAGTSSDVADTSARVAALDVVAGLPPGLVAQLQFVEAPSEAAVELVLSNGPRVLWGTAADTERKAEVLQVVMAEVPDAASYNVSAPDFPSATPD